MPCAPSAADAGLAPSLALSVRVLPSRRLRAWLCLAGATLLLAGAGVLHAPLRFAWPAPVAGVCAATAALLLGAAARPRKARWIDISGPGRIRLTVQQKLAENGLDVRLLPGSALWSHLLVLRLGDSAGRVRVLPVLPDSLPPDQFRALSVALRAIGGRGGPADEMQKIL